MKNPLSARALCADLLIIRQERLLEETVSVLLYCLSHGQFSTAQQARIVQQIRAITGETVDEVLNLAAALHGDCKPTGGGQ